MGPKLKATGSNSDREAALRATLKKRLDEIERVLDGDKNAALNEAQIPKTLEELRFLSVPELGIFSIGSPSTLNRKQSPHLRDLIDWAQDTVTRCKLYRRRPVVKRLSVTARNKLLARRLRRQKLINASLARALHEVENARDLIETDRNALRAQLNIEQRRVAELQRAAGRIPFTVVSPEK